MTERTATAEARANIALTKYWGDADAALHIPANDSISLTLDRTHTVTTVAFRADLARDEVTVDGRKLDGPGLERVGRHLDRFRDLAGIPWRAQVVSQNSFPVGVGIASSASGFAALTMACAAALDLALAPQNLSRLARQGSGSAARSIFGGTVLLRTGERDEEAFAEPLYGPDWWEIIDMVAVLSRAEKVVSSREGHGLAQTSPLHAARVAQVTDLNRRLLAALAGRDFAALGEVAEQDALLMHAVMMTSRPTLLYWLPETVRMLHRVRQWRDEGLPVYFTIDAGPNVHLLTLPASVDRLLAELQGDPDVQEVLVCRPGAGAMVLESTNG